LLGRISSLEKREGRLSTEYNEFKKKYESLNNEYKSLQLRFKNLDEINQNIKNERNKFSLENQEMRQAMAK
jgi:FtsZ-binding cell division protein ZapB